MNFSENLKQLREDIGLSISDLAERAGVALNLLKHYEYKNVRPPFDKLLKIADFYGVSVDHLLRGNKTIFVRNFRLFSLGDRLDKLSYEDFHKVQAFIGSFIDESKPITRFYDQVAYNFKNDFNHNFFEIVKQSGMTLRDFAKKFDLTEGKATSYKRTAECSYETLIELSKFSKASIHFILTGKKLAFNFENRQFEKSLFRADEQLDFRKTSVLIEFMESILAKSKKLQPV